MQSMPCACMRGRRARRAGGSRQFPGPADKKGEEATMCRPSKLGSEGRTRQRPAAPFASATARFTVGGRGRGGGGGGDDGIGGRRGGGNVGCVYGSLSTCSEGKGDGEADGKGGWAGGWVREEGKVGGEGEQEGGGEGDRQVTKADGKGSGEEGEERVGNDERRGSGEGHGGEAVRR
ncbi:unnamed protein product [Closterium sp. NIES-64]|nr:unnamed protein product [Closterium sp. NIES-64]